jgi:hypothetical protein
VLKDTIVFSAKLNSGKRVVIIPQKNTVNWRYMTESEIKNNTFEIFKNYVWMSANVYTVLERGVTLYVVDIEDTPIVLNRGIE